MTATVLSWYPASWTFGLPALTWSELSVVHFYAKFVAYFHYLSLPCPQLLAYGGYLPLHCLAVCPCLCDFCHCYGHHYACHFCSISYIYHGSCTYACMDFMKWHGGLLGQCPRKWLVPVLCFWKSSLQGTAQLSLVEFLMCFVFHVITLSIFVIHTQ